ncbi:unnamed protein product, partial [Trichogramma brassicae]
MFHASRSAAARRRPFQQAAHNRRTADVNASRSAPAADLSITSGLPDTVYSNLSTRQDPAAAAALPTSCPQRYKKIRAVVNARMEIYKAEHGRSS